MDFSKLLGFSESQKKPRALGTLFKELNALLGQYSEQEVKFITGLSGLLGRVAYSDRDISQDELDAIKQVLEKETELSPSIYDAVLEVLKSNAVELVGIEDHHYSQIINEICTREEKIKILNSLFAVAASNESVSFEEDSVIGLISNSLMLSHEDYITARKRVREYLDILKK